MDTTQAASTPKQASGIARISGRIVGQRLSRLQGVKKRLTVLRFPAVDAYAYPNTVEVQSAASLGAVGDDVTVLVKIGGYSRSYDREDGHTGERSKVQTATNTLEAVEG